MEMFFSGNDLKIALATVLLPDPVPPVMPMSTGFRMGGSFRYDFIGCHWEPEGRQFSLGIDQLIISYRRHCETLEW